MKRLISLPLRVALLATLVLTPGAGSTAAADRPRWDWPTAPPHALARQYLAPPTPYGAGHRGIDIRAAGDAVLAPTVGIVHFAGVVVDRPVLSIEHPGGYISSYEPITTTLTKGDPVARGQPIGTLLPGHCAQPCLHFGVRLDGEYVSPLLLLGGVPRAVLLPTRSLEAVE